jgi:hypothetical protein
MGPSRTRQTPRAPCASPTSFAGRPGRRNGLGHGAQATTRDVARQILLALLADLEARSGRAGQSGDHKLAAAYADLPDDVRALLDKLSSILNRRWRDNES